ncbi:MAG: pyridoxamine 5'-phosphate oxidase family protein, partial [Nocardioidaceae bacterium]|nr:pyridoxamine 5'-phosphate oxidase family protein [Nocardioidaceae bacterium]
MKSAWRQAATIEADEIDDLMNSGWSVQVVGRARHVYDQAEVSDVFERLSDPWAPGTRP